MSVQLISLQIISAYDSTLTIHPSIYIHCLDISSYTQDLQDDDLVNRDRYVDTCTNTGTDRYVESLSSLNMTYVTLNDLSDMFYWTL